MIIDDLTAGERRRLYLHRTRDNKRCEEDMLAEYRVYIRIEDVLSTEIAEAIEDYKICGQWD